MFRLLMMRKSSEISGQTVCFRFGTSSQHTRKTQTQTLNRQRLTSVPGQCCRRPHVGAICEVEDEATPTFGGETPPRSPFLSVRQKVVFSPQKGENNYRDRGSGVRGRPNTAALSSDLKLMLGEARGHDTALVTGEQHE